MTSTPGVLREPSILSKLALASETGRANRYHRAIALACSAC